MHVVADFVYAGIKSFVRLLSFCLRAANVSTLHCGTVWNLTQYNPVMSILTTAGLFIVTAVAEIIGCYLPYLWLRHDKSPWLLLPAALSLAAFSWLLTLHPTAAGRVYAAYGGVYVSIACLWLWMVDGVRPDRWDFVGVALCLAGMSVIMLAPREPLSVAVDATAAHSRD